MRFTAVLAYTVISMMFLACARTPVKNIHSLLDKKTFPKDLSVLFTFYRHGEIEPCGCSIVPLGGFEREYNVIKLWGNFEGREVLYLAGGTTFVPVAKEFKPQLIDHYRLKAKVTVEGLSEMGVQVVSPNIDDLSLGVGTFKDLVKNTPVSFVSSNIYLKKTNKPLFQPYLELDYGSSAIIVLGLSQMVSKKGYPKNPEIKVVSPHQVLKSIFEKLPKRSRFVIVISSLKKAERAAMIKAFPQINYVLGEDNENDPTLHVVQSSGSSFYLAPPKLAHYISRVDFAFKEPIDTFYNAKIAVNIPYFQKLQKKDLRSIKQKLAQKKLPKNKRRSLEKIVKIISETMKDEETIPLKPTEKTTIFKSFMVRLNKNFTGANKLTELVKRYKEDIRKKAIKNKTQ